VKNFNTMKLLDAIIFSLSIAFLIIGIHQTITVGFSFSYFFFMLSISLLLLYKLRKGKQKQSKEHSK